MIAERNENTPSMHAVLLKNRGFLEVQGVTDVLRFDEETVVLSTVSGTLTVEGSTLHIRTLNPEKGEVLVEGHVDSLYYEDPVSVEKSGKQGFLGKIFR